MSKEGSCWGLDDRSCILGDWMRSISQRGIEIGSTTRCSKMERCDEEDRGGVLEDHGAAPTIEDRNSS